jgi:FixJ family two-component response regulator
MLSRRRIVVVDDDDSLRRALARTIRLAGYDVEPFANVDELVHFGTCWTGACLVLDVNLPGVSGLDYRRSLAAAGENPPTIFITALDRDAAHAALEALAPSAILYKPFANHELLAAIDRAFRQ